MKKVSLLLLTMLAATMLPAQVNITFQVDMSNETISPDGVHIAGDLNGWSPSDNALADQGDDIYMLTISLNPGSDIQYKYLNGNAWGTEEAASLDCTVGGNNRIFTVPNADDTLELVPFNACPDVIQKNHVVFRVDMSNEIPSADGIHVAGNFVAWDPAAATMTDMGNGIYEYQADVLASILTLQYKYVNGNAWGNEEAIPEMCINGENNRFATPTADSLKLPTYVFASCDTVANSTSIRGLLASDLVQLGMNPIDHTVSLHLAAELGAVQVRLMDLQGRILMQKVIQATALQVDHQLHTSSWAPGIYLVQVSSELGMITKRVLLHQ